jgi:hypothetical protein
MAFFEKTEHQLAFTIEDNGIGFDSEEVMTRLFAGGEVKGFNFYPCSSPLSILYSSHPIKNLIMRNIMGDLFFHEKNKSPRFFYTFRYNRRNNFIWIK